MDLLEKVGIFGTLFVYLDLFKKLRVNTINMIISSITCSISLIFPLKLSAPIVHILVIADNISKGSPTNIYTASKYTILFFVIVLTLMLLFL